MDKPSAVNGFTLIEMLLVLFIITVLGITGSSTRISSLHLFGQKMMAWSVLMQEQAFATKTERTIQIQKRQAQFGEHIWSYPEGIACTPFTLHYNALGHISQAKSIICTEKEKQITLIYQLGSGRVHLE